MEKDKECSHYFELGQIALENTEANLMYRKVAYVVCRKCGEVKKQDI